MEISYIDFFFFLANRLKNVENKGKNFIFALKWSAIWTVLIFIELTVAQRHYMKISRPDIRQIWYRQDTYLIILRSCDRAAS